MNKMGTRFNDLLLTYLVNVNLCSVRVRMLTEKYHWRVEIPIVVVDLGQCTVFQLVVIG